MGPQLKQTTSWVGDEIKLDVQSGVQVSRMISMEKGKIINTIALTSFGVVFS